MHPDFEKYRAPSDECEQVNVRLPRALTAQVKVLAGLESDTMTGLMTEATARLIEAREAEPMVDPELIQQKIDSLTSELNILRGLQSRQQ